MKSYNNLPKLRNTQSHNGRYVGKKRFIYRLLAGLFCLGVIGVIGAISYAFFTVDPASKNQSAILKTAKVSVIFADNDAGIHATLDFGESFTKKFTIENDGDVTAHVKMYWKDLVNTYTEESLSYTLSASNEENGMYTPIIDGEETKSLVPQANIASTKVLADSIEVAVGTTYYELTVTLNKLTTDQNADINAQFYSWFKIEDINYKESSVIDKIIASSKGPLTTGFDKPASTAELAGVYELEDEGNMTSYYFRGPVENNYAKFGKWNDDEPDVYVGHHASLPTAMDFTSLAACQADSEYNNNCTLLQRAGKDMYWRIIRVNGDGSLRMIYAGTQIHANDEQADDTFIKAGQQFNKLADDAKYIGYMYGPANAIEGTTTPSINKVQAQENIVSADVKIALESWYEKNLEANYGQYISKDAIFCNDRSIDKGASGWSQDTGLGYGANNTAYGAMNRFVDVSNDSWLGKINSLPTFKCPQNNDKFTVEGAKTGNHVLNKPVGLISADEIVAAGSGKYNTPSDFYLKRNLYYLSLTPYDNTKVFGVYSDGKLYRSEISGIGASIAPVINLSPEYASTMIYGTGDMDNPYHA